MESDPFASDIFIKSGLRDMVIDQRSVTPPNLGQAFYLAIPLWLIIYPEGLIVIGNRTFINQAIPLSQYQIGRFLIDYILTGNSL